MAYFSHREIGLSEAEAQALIEHASLRNDDLKAMDFSAYDLKEGDRFEASLRKLVSTGKITIQKAHEFSAIRDIAKTRLAAFLPIADTCKKEEKYGFFTDHPSFGCVSHHVISTTPPTFVGTPTMDHTMIGLKFSQAHFGFGMIGREEPRLSESFALVEINLAAEQFAGLMRDRESSSPCALSRNTEILFDKPPRLIATVSIASSAKSRAMEIGKPLIDACKSLREFLESDQKISTKADYAALDQRIEAVKQAMETIREPMQQLLAETAGLMADASSRQMLADIAEPLKALGMDASIMKLLTHN